MKERLLTSHIVLECCNTNNKQVLDLSNHNDHGQFCEWVLSRFNHPFTLTDKEQHEFAEDINQYRLILDADHLCHEFKHMINDLKRHQKRWMAENKQLIMELVGFVKTILNNDNFLLVKYLFCSKVKKSTLLLEVLISAMLYECQYNIINNYFHYAELIFDSIPCWKKVHFLYAINKGFCMVLLEYFIKNDQTNGILKLNEMSHENYVHLICFIPFIIKFKISDYFLGKFYNACTHTSGGQKLKALRLSYYVFADALIKRAMNDLEYKTVIKKRKLEVSGKRKCGWIKCNKTKSDHYCFFKCKRCKLVSYCCRNHQKKHWKYIHNMACRHII